MSYRGLQEYFAENIPRSLLRNTPVSMDLDGERGTESGEDEYSMMKSRRSFYSEDRQHRILVVLGKYTF